MALSLAYWRRDRIIQLTTVMTLGYKVADVGRAIRRGRNGRDGIKFSHNTSLVDIHAYSISTFSSVRLKPCLDMGTTFQRSLAPKIHQFRLLLLRRGSRP